MIFLIDLLLALVFIAIGVLVIHYADTLR